MPQTFAGTPNHALWEGVVNDNYIIDWMMDHGQLIFYSEYDCFSVHFHLPEHCTYRFFCKFSNFSFKKFNQILQQPLPFFRGTAAVP